MTAAPRGAGRFGALEAWLAPLAAPERRADVAGGVTLVVLLLSTEPTWVMQVGVGSLAAAAVVDRRLLRSAAYWFAVLAVYVIGVSRVALLIDNHEWLLGYWLLALGVSRLGEEPAASLATSARLLIGLAFAFATLWKLATPDYTSGNMFHAFLLFDPRFVGVGPAFSGLSLEAAAQNYALFGIIETVADADVTLPVADDPGVRRVALAMTGWTVAIEGLVAVCSLAPPESVVGRARHGALLVFLYTTYMLAPVIGFGWVLIAMGLAQAPLERRRWLLPAFAGAFVLVLVRGTAPVGKLLALLA